MNFWFENEPSPNLEFSKKSSVLVPWPLPKHVIHHVSKNGVNLVEPNSPGDTQINSCSTWGRETSWRSGVKRPWSLLGVEEQSGRGGVGGDVVVSLWAEEEEKDVDEEEEEEEEEKELLYSLV